MHRWRCQELDLGGSNYFCFAPPSSMSQSVPMYCLFWIVTNSYGFVLIKRAHWVEKYDYCI